MQHRNQLILALVFHKFYDPYPIPKHPASNAPHPRIAPFWAHVIVTFACANNMDVVKDVAMKDAPVEEGKDCKGDEDSEQQPKTKKDKDILTAEGL